MPTTTPAHHKEQLEALQDEAVRDSISRIGSRPAAPIVSDGEQRWSSFATYSITDTLAGTGLAAEPGVVAASISPSSPTVTTASCRA